MFPRTVRVRPTTFGFENKSIYTVETIVKATGVSGLYHEWTRCFQSK